MALATYTSTVFNNSPKGIHVGDQSVSGQLTWGATSTVGDVAFLCKVPHGAKIVDFCEYHTTGATTQVLKFGFDKGVVQGGGGSASFIAANFAQGTLNQRNAALIFGGTANAPTQISVSDLDPVKYATLLCKVASGTTTTSLFVNFLITYRIDGPDIV